MALPPPQDELVRAVAAVNPRTVVVVNAASPVEMDWADDVGAVLQCWFAGEEWGNALADVLSGDVSPSGKLPTTFPVRIEDTPAFTSYPGERGQVHYGEGVFVGYRWYDARRIEPRFCFGHGLSYTTFALDAPAVSAARGVARRARATARPCASSCRVRNTGTRRGAEVVQCYVHDVEASVARPPQELKAFAKVWLDPGAARRGRARARPARVRVLGRRRATTWTVEPGEFELRIGTSSRDIAHRVTLTVDGVTPMTRPTLTVGLANYGSTFPPDEWYRFVDLGRAAEDAGVDRIVVVDHVVMGPHTENYAWGKFPVPPEAPWFEPLTMLAAIAAVDRRACGSRPASSSRRCGRPRCSPSRSRRST